MIILFEQAKEQGLSKYFTGKPCRNGHIAERYVCSKGCVVCSYDNEKRYKKSDPERTTARRQAYRKKNHTSILEKDRKYRENNREKRAFHRRNYKKLNKERTPKWFGEFDELVLEEAIVLCRVRENETGIEWHVDHMYPLQAKKVSGLHCAENFQVIPGIINVSKQNKMILTQRNEWLKS